MDSTKIKKMRADIDSILIDVKDAMRRGQSSYGRRRQLQRLCRNLRVAGVNLYALQQRLEENESKCVQDARDLPIEDIGLSVRALKCIQNLRFGQEGLGIKTVGELVDNVRVAHLMRMRGFGKRSLSIVEDCLWRLEEEYGTRLTLRQ